MTLFSKPDNIPEYGWMQLSDEQRLRLLDYNMQAWWELEGKHLSDKQLIAMLIMGAQCTPPESSLAK